MSRRKKSVGKWSPPDLTVRKAALGPFLERDDPVLCAACCSCSGGGVFHSPGSSTRPPGCFAPLCPPKPGYWLYDGNPGEDERFGQPFPEYVRGGGRGRRKFPSRNRRTIYLCPIERGCGADDAEAGLAMMGKLREFVEAYFVTPCRLMEPLTPSERRKLMGRSDPLPQLLTGPIHKILRRRKGMLVDAFAVMGVTMVDLYPNSKWNFVFGEADVEKGVGVFSFARYDPDFSKRWEAAFEGGGKRGRATEQEDATRWPPLPQDSSDHAAALFLLRAAKTLAHEIGHLFHLEHCVFYQCVMNGANNLAESDDSPLHLCPICLRKLHHALGKARASFDPIKRYHALALILGEMHLKEESEWATAAAERCMAALDGRDSGGTAAGFADYEAGHAAICGRVGLGMEEVSDEKLVAKAPEREDEEDAKHGVHQSNPFALLGEEIFDETTQQRIE